MRLLTAIAALVLAAPATAACGDGSGELDVLTYNTWGLPSPIAKQRKQRIPAIGEWLDEQAFDVVGLQEVWRGAMPLLRIRGLFAANSDQGDSGLAMVTGHDVKRSRVVHFRDARGIERFKRKGVLASTMDVSGWGSLAVWNTHLQASNSERSARVRRGQIDQLLAEAERTAAPMVLMGDFNLYDDNSEDQVTDARLAAAGFVDVAAATGTGAGTYPGVADRFDRVYVRDGDERCLAPKRTEVLQEAAPMSDHLPVRAVVELR